MKIIKTIKELRENVKGYKQSDQTVALVPTMGNLHAGHLDLVKKAKTHAGKVVVSIFVNPTQFDQADDLEAYPRTMEADLTALEALAVDLVFAPAPAEMYPHGGLVTEIDIPKITHLHEGSSRPGHFKGVATVVCKLFNIVSPDVAVFGQKDFQQLALIRQMVADLDLPISIIGVPTIREPDGLAMSSRNNRLTTEERNLAPSLYRVMKQLEKEILSGEQEYKLAELRADKALSTAGLSTDYIKVCSASTLLPAGDEDRELVILAAAYLGDIRLIDNLQLSLSE